MPNSHLILENLRKYISPYITCLSKIAVIVLLFKIVRVFSVASPVNLVSEHIGTKSFKIIKIKEYEQMRFTYKYNENII